MLGGPGSQGHKVDLKEHSVLSLADELNFHSYHESFHQDAAKTVLLM